MVVMMTTMIMMMVVVVVSGNRLQAMAHDPVAHTQTDTWPIFHDQSV